MKTYIITVNGQRYEVNVEEKGVTPGVTGATPAAAVPSPAVAPASVPAPVAAAPPPPPVVPLVAAAPTPAAPATRGAAGPGTITAPMPGKVIAIKVKPGAQVKTGQVLLILEAMKMENEITATSAGTVKEVYVSEGASVNVCEPLVTIVQA